MSRRNVDLGSGSVGKLLFSLAVPTITSQIVNMLYNLVDRVYIGHMQPVETVGKLALTGVGVCLPIIMVISAFAALMAFGGAPRASIAEGRGDLKESERIMGNSFTMLVAVSVVLTVVFLVFAEPMLRIFGASDNTIGYALNYMRIYALGTIFVQVTLGMNAYITAQGFTVVGMKTVLIGAILNTVLDPIFIFAFGMGVRGAALATILSQAVSAVWVLKFLTGSKTKWHLRREHLRPQAKVVLPALALGASPFIMQSTESLITVCFNSSLLKYGGDIAVGAMTVLQHHAVRHDAPPGPDPRGPAHHQLQLRRPESGAGTACLPGAADGLPGILPAAVGAGAAVPPAVRPDVHLGQRAGELCLLGPADLHGGHRDLRYPDRLSADLRGPGQRQDLLVPGSAAEDHPADSLHLYSAQLFCG